MLIIGCCANASSAAQVQPFNISQAVVAYSQEYGISPYLVISVIKAESNFQNNALSSKNCIGLMQVSPGTAKLVEPGITTSDLWDPATNLRIGTIYLKSLLVKFNNNVPYTLAAYNAGPGNVYNWLYKNKNLNVADIPYKETRDYIHRIIGVYNVYKSEQVLAGYQVTQAPKNSNLKQKNTPSQENSQNQYVAENDIAFYKTN